MWALSVYLQVTYTTSLLAYCGFVSIHTSYVHNVTFNILWFCQYIYELRAQRHFYILWFVSIPSSYVRYVTFTILWICQYTYLRVTCATSLSPYCGFVSIPTSYVHNVTFNILWYRDMKYLRCKWVSEWLNICCLTPKWTVLSATSWWEPVAFRWIVDDDVRFVLDHQMKMDFHSTSSLKEQSEGRYCALIGHSEPNIICSYSLVLRAFH
jgi:hypothetical protein